MILKSKQGALVSFGNGTVKVDVSNDKQVTLTECYQTPLGNVPEKEVFDGPVVSLHFGNIESLEVLISKLEELREDFREAEC